jgi:hypothetical protein
MAVVKIISRSNIIISACAVGVMVVSGRFVLRRRHKNIAHYQSSIQFQALTVAGEIGKISVITQAGIQPNGEIINRLAALEAWGGVVCLLMRLASA